MRIVNLVENTMGACGCEAEHGLSFYIETEHHKLLMDCGSSDMFLRNAERLGIDLTHVDTVVLSHGHYDHAGGIMALAELNPRVKIYAAAAAGREYYSITGGLHYIGIDKRIMELPGYCAVEGNLQIDEELFLFSGITGNRCPAKGNRSLKEMVNGELVQDEFAHEQCLVITQGEERILFSGCAHHGILNVLDRYRELFSDEPALVLSGFHMMQADGYDADDLERIRDTAHELMQMRTTFYTGHCTGAEPCAVMKEVMGDQLQILYSGAVIRG